MTVRKLTDVLGLDEVLARIRSVQTDKKIDKLAEEIGAMIIAHLNGQQNHLEAEGLDGPAMALAAIWAIEGVVFAVMGSDEPSAVEGTELMTVAGEVETAIGAIAKQMGGPCHGSCELHALARILGILMSAEKFAVVEVMMDKARQDIANNVKGV